LRKVQTLATLTCQGPGIVVEMAVDMRKWPVLLGSGIFQPPARK
jgi:hypothetical protein